AARGPAARPGRGGVPAVGRPVHRGQGRAAARDGGVRRDGHAAPRVSGPLPVRVAEGGSAVNPIKAWNRFLFAPISARPLGLFRIVFGVLMMIYLAVMTVEFDHWYTDRGLLQGTESREAAGPLRLSPLHYVHDPITPRVLYAITFAAAAGVTLGWRTRVMS